MISIQEYKSAVKESKTLREELNKKEQSLNRTSEEVKDRFWNLEHDLREKRIKEQNKIDKEMENLESEYNEKLNPLYDKQSQFKRIIDLMEVYKEGTETDLNIEMYNYDSPNRKKIYLKPLAVLKDNEFYKIEVFIYENKKPKNKYTLAGVGRSVFCVTNILKFNWSFLSSINENGHFKGSLKASSDRQELIKWFEKNKDKIFKEKINKIEETIKEYQEVIKHTDNKEWEIEYWKNKQDYYENHYSRGTKQEEYQEVINNLIGLTTGKEKEAYRQILKKLIIQNLKPIEN